MMQKIEKKTLVIIDANAVIHRSYHALPPLTAPDGMVVNAVYGFCSLLLKVLREVKPTHCAAAFDLAGPTFRHKAYEAYKATRVKAPDDLYAQMPVVKKLLGAFRIPVFELEGYEADDLIGTITEQMKKSPGTECVIVTGDMDTLQLVRDGVRIYTLKSGIKETQMLGTEEVLKRYGIPPAHIADFKGLKGDPSDNIPGVPGIGEKTASALLQKFGTLQKLYEAVEAIPNSQKAQNTKSTKHKSLIEKPFTEKLVALLREYREQAFFSKELATINCAVPVDFSLDEAGREKFDRDAVVSLLRQLGFMSLVERLPDTTQKPLHPTTITTANSIAPLTQGMDAPEGAEPLTEALLKEIGSTKELHIALYTELLLGSEIPQWLALEASGYRGFIAIGDLQKNTKIQELLRVLFGDAGVKKICHGAKHLMHALDRLHIALAGPFFDTELAYLLIRPGSRDVSLKTAVLQELGEEFRMSAETTQMAAYQLHCIGRLYRVLSEKIQRHNLSRVCYEIEMPLVPVLWRMEKAGIAVDPGEAASLGKRFEKELATLEHQIHALAGLDFNINSTKELRSVLFEKMGIAIKGLRKTAGGVTSTQASELEKLKTAHPIIEKILSYREFFKIKTTYLDPLPGLIGADGRLHTTFQQIGAATGRISSQEPNLQNIPVRGEWGSAMRSLFVAPKGSVLLAADYSQIELRVAAHLSKDPVMQDAFKHKQDIHARTAGLIFGISPGNVAPDQRALAKTLNFGVLYGMGPQAFSETAKISVEEAKKFIAEYFKEFPALKGYLDAVRAEAEARGFVETLFGRRRYIPEMRSTNPMVRRAAERMAINMPIQGTATADMIKRAMVGIADRLEKERLEERVRLLLQVHDELVFEIHDHAETLRHAARLIKEEMEQVIELSVPLVADIKIGPDWGHMKPVDRN
ncbi:MAG: DNA polymerase I [bacterium]|nr:DNA polymerase I [bacterium]